MGKNICSCLVFSAVAAVLFLTPFSVDAASGNINFIISQKFMDDSKYWKPSDRQKEFGVIFDIAERSWPAGIELGYLSSSDKDSDKGTERKGKTEELTLGVKKIWVIRNFPLKPFISGGLAYVSAKDQYRSNFYRYKEDDSDFGIYFSAGAYTTLSRHINLGFMFRITRAELDLIDDDVNAGGEHFCLFAGLHF